MKSYCLSHRMCVIDLLIELCDGVVVEIDTSKSQFMPRVIDFEKKVIESTKGHRIILPE